MKNIAPFIFIIIAFNVCNGAERFIENFDGVKVSELENELGRILISIENQKIKEEKKGKAKKLFSAFKRFTKREYSILQKESIQSKIMNEIYDRYTYVFSTLHEKNIKHRKEIINKMEHVCKTDSQKLFYNQNTSKLKKESMILLKLNEDFIDERSPKRRIEIGFNLFEFSKYDLKSQRNLLQHLTNANFLAQIHNFNLSDSCGYLMAIIHLTESETVKNALTSQMGKLSDIYGIQIKKYQENNAQSSLGVSLLCAQISYMLSNNEIKLNIINLLSAGKKTRYFAFISPFTMRSSIVLA